MTPLRSEPKESPISATNAWFLVHIVLPLLPPILGTLVRLWARFGLTWETFGASELSLCLAFVMFFSGQNLSSADLILSDSDKENDRKGASMACFIFAIFLVVIFALIEATNTFVTYRGMIDLEPQLHALQIGILPFGAAAIWYARRVQRSFKLTVRMP